MITMATKQNEMSPSELMVYYHQTHEIDVHALIRNLKFVFNIDLDNELAALLGIDTRALSMFKLRNRITGSGWEAILRLSAHPLAKGVDWNTVIRNNLVRKAQP